MKQCKTTFNHHQQWKQKRCHADGYVDVTTMPVFNYHLKDHASTPLSTSLGNVRAVISSSYGPGAYTLTQASDYYPFGMAHTVEISSIKNGKALEAVRVDPREIMDDSKTFTRSNAYLYNGKEEQPMPGKWLDYGAQFYDAQLGRWTTPDPLVEDDASWSPYNYVRNNPIAHNDPDGRFWNYVIGAAAGAVAEYAGQVVASSIRDGGFSVENLYKDIDLVDIGLSTVEGALTSGGSVVKGFAKVGVVVGSEIARNAVDGTISEGVTTNGVGETAKNTAIGLSLGKIGDAAPAPKVKVVNAPTPKQAVNQARQEAKAAGNVVDREKRVATETQAKSNQAKAKGANEAAGKTLQNSAASMSSETTKKLTDEKKR